MIRAKTATAIATTDEFPASTRYAENPDNRSATERVPRMHAAGAGVTRRHWPSLVGYSMLTLARFPAELAAFRCAPHELSFRRDVESVDKLIETLEIGDEQAGAEMYRLFFRSDLDPGKEPSSMIMRRAIAACIRDRARPGTSKPLPTPRLASPSVPAATGP